MRILLDTNVLISSVITQGACHELLGHSLRVHKVVASDFIREEFVTKLTMKFKFSKHEALSAAELIFQRVVFVVPMNVVVPGLKDKNDLPILGTALAGDCDLIITGDKELLKLGTFKGIQLISPAEYWNIA